MLIELDVLIIYLVHILAVVWQLCKGVRMPGLTLLVRAVVYLFSVASLKQIIVEVVDVQIDALNIVADVLDVLIQ